MHVLTLDSIRLDGGTQPRVGIDPAIVADYAEQMSNGAVFPPVIVFHDGADHWLADGFHRVAAAEKAGFGEISADVRQGTRRDAVLFSAGVNAAHGLRRTNADKHRAIETLLRDDEWSRWSDREIARRVSVDHKTVASVRAQLVTSGEIPAYLTRQVERAGTVYRIATEMLYKPTLADDADVEAARQIALEIVFMSRDRDHLRSRLDAGERGEHDQSGAVYLLGAGLLEFNDADHTVGSGKIAVGVATPNGAGVFRFDAYQLYDWVHARDALIDDEAALMALLRSYEGPAWTQDEKVVSKLSRYGLLAPNADRKVVLTPYGRLLVKRRLDADPFLKLSVQVRSEARLQYAPHDEFRDVLLQLYNKQQKSGEWQPPWTFRSANWLDPCVERGLILRTTRLIAEGSRTIPFYAMTPEMCALIEHDPLPEIPEPPQLQYNEAVRVFVPADAEFRFAVGDTVVEDVYNRKCEVVSHGAWPLVEVKELDSTYRYTWSIAQDKLKPYDPADDEQAAQATAALRDEADFDLETQLLDVVDYLRSAREVVQEMPVSDLALKLAEGIDALLRAIANDPAAASMELGDFADTTDFADEYEDEHA